MLFSQLQLEFRVTSYELAVVCPCHLGPPPQAFYGPTTKSLARTSNSNSQLPHLEPLGFSQSLPPKNAAKLYDEDGSISHNRSPIIINRIVVRIRSGQPYSACTVLRDWTHKTGRSVHQPRGCQAVRHWVGCHGLAEGIPRTSQHHEQLLHGRVHLHAL